MNYATWMHDKKVCFCNFIESGDLFDSNLANTEYIVVFVSTF
jgi:hypothetical protein